MDDDYDEQKYNKKRYNSCLDAEDCERRAKDECNLNNNCVGWGMEGTMAIIFLQILHMTHTQH